MVQKHVLRVLVLVSLVATAGCGQDPALLWLARNGDQPAHIKNAVAKRSIVRGMPKEAALAVISSHGFLVLEDKVYAGGINRIVYRRYAHDSVGKRHSARTILVIRNGVVENFDTVPER